MRGVQWVAVALNWLWMQFPVRRAALAQEKKKRILRAAEHLRRFAVTVAQAKKWEALAHRRAEVMARAADDLDAGGGAKLTAAILRIHAGVLPPEPEPATPVDLPPLLQRFADNLGPRQCLGCGAVLSWAVPDEQPCPSCGLQCPTEMGPALEPNSEGYFVEVKTAAGWKLLTVTPVATQEEAKQHMKSVGEVSHFGTYMLRVAGRPLAACPHAVIDPRTLKCQGCGADKSDIDNVPLAERAGGPAPTGSWKGFEPPVRKAAPQHKPSDPHSVCEACDGTGAAGGAKCGTCEGSGVIWAGVPLSVQDEWQRCRLDPIRPGDIWVSRTLKESSPKFFATVAGAVFGETGCYVDIEYANGDQLRLPEGEFRNRFRLFEKKGV